MFIVPITSMLLLLFKKDKNNIENIEKDSTYPETSLLCKFVLNETGKKVGESIALDGDIVIIKSGNKYLGVPLKHIEDEGKTMLVKGLIDYSKAEELGEHWRKDSFCGLNLSGNEK